MKRLLATIVLLLALASVPVSVHAFGNHDRGLRTAREMFIPIACTSPQIFRWRTGTGFPVGEHLVMTARHIDCHEAFGPEAVTEISDDGLHWVIVPDEGNTPHPSLDVRVYYLPALRFTHIAKFRSPVLGENTTGYGVAFGETADFGRVIKIADGAVFSSATAIGGMSGSAIVADDGDVIGIAVQGVATIIGDGIPSSFVSSGPDGGVLQNVMDGYHKTFSR